MKTNKLIILALTAALFFNVGCNKDNDSGNNIVFSGNTIEEDKQAIEDAAIALIKASANVEKEPAIDANEAFLFFIEKSDPFMANPVVKIAGMRGSYGFLPNYALSENAHLGFNAMLKAIALNPINDEPETITEFYDLLKGEYAWNSNFGKWVFSAGGNAIVFKFPSEESKSENSAVYTILYEGYTGNIAPQLGDVSELPKNVKTNLTLNGIEIMRFHAKIDYTSQGMPVGASTALYLGDYALKFAAENIDNKEANLKFIFEENSELLLKFVLTGKGDWSEENIDNNTHYYKYIISNNGDFQEIEVTDVDDFDTEEVDIHKIIVGGNSLFQVGDIKVAGTMDLETLGEEIIDIDDNSDLNDSIYTQKMCDVLNKHIDLSLRYADTEKVIALVEAYPIPVTVTYNEYFYAGTWNDSPQLIEETFYEFGFRFAFADDSRIDFEVYFGEGFEDLVTEMEKFMLELENSDE